MSPVAFLSQLKPVGNDGEHAFELSSKEETKLPKFFETNITFTLAPRLYNIIRKEQSMSRSCFHPFFIYTGRRKCREVWPDENLEKTFTVFLDVVLLIVPLCIMGAMYGLIVKQLWKADKGKQSF